MSYKMTIGERIVEVTDKGGAWLVSTGNLFLSSWQSVLCPSTQHLLQVREQISGWEEGKASISIPEGCKMKRFEEAEEGKDKDALISPSWTEWRNKNWQMGDKVV